MPSVTSFNDGLVARLAYRKIPNFRRAVRVRFNFSPYWNFDFRLVKEKIALESTHLDGTCKVAFQMLVQDHSGVTGAVSSFGFGPFRYRGNETPELFDYRIVRTDRSEAGAGTTQAGNQIVHAQNSSKIL